MPLDTIQDVEANEDFKAMAPVDKRRAVALWVSKRPGFEELDDHERAQITNRLQGRYADPTPVSSWNGPMGELKGKFSTFGGEADKALWDKNIVVKGIRQGDPGVTAAFSATKNPKYVTLGDPKKLYAALPPGIREKYGLQWDDPITITHPKTGKSVTVPLWDSGPHPSTGRILDVSPYAMQLLGGNTDDVVTFHVPNRVEANRQARAGLAAGRIATVNRQNQMVQQALQKRGLSPALVHANKPPNTIGPVPPEEIAKRQGKIAADVDAFNMRFFNTENRKANVPMQAADALSKNPNDEVWLSRVRRMSPVSQIAIAMKAAELRHTDQSEAIILPSGGVGAPPSVMMRDKTTGRQTPMELHRPSEVLARVVRGPVGAEHLQRAQGFLASAERFLYGLPDPENVGLMIAGGAGPRIAQEALGVGFTGIMAKNGLDKWRAGDKGGAYFDWLLASLGGYGSAKGAKAGLAERARAVENVRLQAEAAAQAGGESAFPYGRSVSDAAQTRQGQEGRVGEHPGVPQGTDVRQDQGQVRQEESRQAGGGGGAVGAAAVGTQEAQPEVKPAGRRRDARGRFTIKEPEQPEAPAQPTVEPVETTVTRPDGTTYPEYTMPSPLVAAAYRDPAGQVHTGPHHPAILTGIHGKVPDEFQTAESRNTPSFGFVDKAGNFLDRKEAAVRVKQTGQDLKTFESGEPAHSDEVAAKSGGIVPISESGIPVTTASAPDTFTRMSEVGNLPPSSNAAHIMDFILKSPIPDVVRAFAEGRIKRISQVFDGTDYSSRDVDASLREAFNKLSEPQKSVLLKIALKNFDESTKDFKTEFDLTGTETKTLDSVDPKAFYFAMEAVRMAKNPTESLQSVTGVEFSPNVREAKPGGTTPISETVPTEPTKPTFGDVLAKAHAAVVEAQKLQPGADVPIRQAWVMAKATGLIDPKMTLDEFIKQGREWNKTDAALTGSEYHLAQGATGPRENRVPTYGTGEIGDEKLAYVRAPKPVEPPAYGDVETLKKASQIPTYGRGPEYNDTLAALAEHGIPVYKSIDDIPNASQYRYHGTWFGKARTILESKLKGLLSNLDDARTRTHGDIVFAFPLEGADSPVNVTDTDLTPVGKPVAAVLSKDAQSSFDYQKRVIAKKESTPPVEPPAPTPPPVEGAPEGETTGIAHRVLETRAEAGRIEPVERGAAVSTEEAMNRGRRALKSGADPEEVIRKFNQTGEVSENALALARAHDEVLARAAVAAERQFGRNSPEYEAAYRASSDWAKRMKPLATAWSNIGRIFQGETDIDTGSFTFLRREFQDVYPDKDFTPQQASEAEKRASQLSDLQIRNSELEKRVDELMKAAADRQEKKPPRTVRGKTSERLPSDPAKLREHFATRIKDGSLFAGPKSKQTGAVRISGLPNFTSEEVRAIWNHAKKNYIGMGNVAEGRAFNFDETVNRTAADLGLEPDWVRHAFTLDKSVRTVVPELYELNSRRRQMIQQAKLWARTLNTPVYRRVAGAINEGLRSVLLLGHGTIGMMTHAGTGIFRPTSWPVYWKNLFKQLPVFFGQPEVGGHVGMSSRAVHEAMVRDIERDPEYAFKIQSGLKIQPGIVYDDMQSYMQYLSQSGSRLGKLAERASASPLLKPIGKAGSAIGELSERGNRAMDVLKKNRSEMFTLEWNRLSDDLKTPAMAKLLAEWINHSNGAGDIGYGSVKGIAKTTMLAPSLEASRWARMVGDPIKTGKTFLNWKDTTPEEQAMAKFRTKRAAELASVYLGFLAANYGAQAATGQKDRVNFLDATKSDWLRFKWNGKTFDPTGNMMAPIHFLAGLLQTTYGPDRQYGMTKRERELESIYFYGRSKLAPGPEMIEAARTGEDVMGRPMPWVTPPARPSPNKPQYTWSEYLLQRGPIPASGAIREVYSGLREQGMSDSDTRSFLANLFSPDVLGTFAAESIGMRVGKTPKDGSPVKRQPAIGSSSFKTSGRSSFKSSF